MLLYTWQEAGKEGRLIQSSGAKYNQINFSKNHVSGNARIIGITVIWWFTFHQSLDDKCHRFLNAVEPGTKVEIHRHPTKDESFVLLRGRVRVNTYNDDGTVIE